MAQQENYQYFSDEKSLFGYALLIGAMFVLQGSWKFCDTLTS